MRKKYQSEEKNVSQDSTSRNQQEQDGSEIHSVMPHEQEKILKIICQPQWKKINDLLPI